MDALAELRSPDLAFERFAATGAQKMSAEDMRRLREGLDAVARKIGYPERSQANRQAFDHAMAQFLAAEPFEDGEMLRPDVWTWLAVHLAPHLVFWRFADSDGKVSEERSAGIIQRNALGRLWLRGRIFDRGLDADARWGLVNSLSEDATVAILERTSISADWQLARAVGEAWLAARNAGAEADDLLRHAAIRVRIQVAVVETGLFNQLQLQEFVSRLFIRKDAKQERGGKIA